MNDILKKLADNKEKLLFGFVVLVALSVALKAPWGGAGVSEINNEQRDAAITAAGYDRTKAEQVLKQVQVSDYKPRPAKAEDPQLRLF